MKRGAPRSLKAAELGAALDIPRPFAAGLLATLWDIVREEAPDGLIRWTPAVLAQELGWPGDPGKLVAALVATRWLDQLEAGLYVHDWHEHAEDWVHGKLARAGRLFGNGMRPSLKKLDQKERVEAERLLAAAGGAARRRAAPGGGPRPPALPCLASNGSPPLSPPPASRAGGNLRTLLRQRAEVVVYLRTLGQVPTRPERRRIYELLAQGLTVEQIKASIDEREAARVADTQAFDAVTAKYVAEAVARADAREAANPEAYAALARRVAAERAQFGDPPKPVPVAEAGDWGLEDRRIVGG